MRRWSGLVWVLGLVAVACSSPSGGRDEVSDAAPEIVPDAPPEIVMDAAPPDPVTGEFSILTYNVAGLPDIISKSNPEEFIPQISPLLNAYDLVLVQEDFAYHDELASEAEHPFQTRPMFESPDQVPMGDGLNRFSVFPTGPLHRLQWPGCNGDFDCASDCLATKGFSLARVQLAPGITLDVYNLHGEAGGCPEDVTVRLLGYQRLAEYINTWSVGRPVLVAGDFNLRWTDPEDVPPLELLVDDAGLTEACLALDCGDEHIDKVFFRSNEALLLEPLTWAVPPEFVDPAGEDLSDHEPVAVRFAWTGTPSAGAAEIDTSVYPETLSVVTFNMLHGLSDEDPAAQPFDRLSERLELMGDALAASADGLVALQEVSLMPAADYPDVLGVLLGALDREACPACHGLFGAIGGTAPSFDAGDAVGQLTLSRLPQSGPVHNRQVSPLRAVTHLRVDSALGKVDLYNVHLQGSDPAEDGVAEADAVLAFVEETSELDHIVLLAGDFNSTPDSAALARFEDAGFMDLGAASGLACDAPGDDGCTNSTLPLGETGLRAEVRIDYLLMRGDGPFGPLDSDCVKRFGAAVPVGDGHLWPSDHVGLACILSRSP
jgi:endonuclease/exonuclease/phosphatase family metal-dependent hydrolase